MEMEILKKLMLNLFVARLCKFCHVFCRQSPRAIIPKFAVVIGKLIGVTMESKIGPVVR